MLPLKRFVMLKLNNSLTFLLLCAYLLAQVSLGKINSLVFVIIQSNFVVDLKPPMNKINIESERQIKENRQTCLKNL